MKCPHCSEQLDLLSRETNEIRRTGTCPECGRAVKFGLLQWRFALAFLVTAMILIALGQAGAFVAGMAGGMGAAFGLGLKSAEP